MKNPTAPALKVCYKRPLLPGSITHRKFFLPAVALFLAALLGSINGASAQMVEVQIDPSSLDTTYDGTPKEAIVTTNPPGAYVMVTYNGDPTPPTNAGSYDVEATISDSTYYGSACATLTIAKAELGLEASNLTQTYNGTYLPITIKAAAGQSNLPASIGVSYSNQSNPYGWPGSGSSYAQYSLNGEYYTLDPASLPYPPATDAANYSVSISFDDPNYQSSASFWLTVNKAQLSDFISVPSQNIPYDSYGNWPSIYNVNFLKSIWLGTLNVSIQGNYVSPSSKSYTSSWDNYYQNPGYLYPDNNSGYPYNYSIYLQSTGYWESGNWISYSGQYPGYPGPTTQPYTISITSTNPNIEGEVTAQLDVAAHKVNFSNYGEQSYEYDGTYKIPYIQAFNSDYPYHYGGYNIPDIIALSYSTYYSPWIYNNVFYASRGYYYGYPYYGYPYYGYGNDYQLIPPGSPLPYWGGTQPTRIPIPSPGSHTLNVDAADPMNSWSRNYIGSSSYQFQVYHKNVYFEVTGNAPSENSRPVVEAQASDGYISVPISLSGVIVYDQNGDPVGTHPPDISVTYSPVNGGSDIVATYSTNPATYGVSNSFTYYPSPSNPPTPPGEYNVRIQPIYPNWNYQYWEQQNFFNFHGFSDSNMIVAKLRVLGNTTVAPDTDGDGVNDYREALDGSNPNDANSFNSLSKGLVAYYPLKNTFEDCSGSNNDLKNPTTGISFLDGPLGVADSAIVFTTKSDTISSESSLGIVGNEAHSITFWVFLPEPSFPAWTGVEGTLVSIGIGGVGGLSQIFSDDHPNGGGRLVAHGEYADMELINLGNSFLGKWHHVVYVYDGSVSGSRIFLDGLAASLRPWPGGNLIDSKNLASTPLVLGAPPSGPAAAPGARLAEVRIYNRALTAEEVSQLYTQESRPSNPPVIFENSLYTTVPGPSWTDAEANAQKLGGHLVAINSEEENDFLWAEFSNATKYRIRPNAYDAPEVFSHWIGLTDDGHEGDWKWSNGEPLTFVNAFWEDFEGISQPDQNWARVSWNVPASWTGNIETRGLWQRHNLYAYQNGNETPTGIAEIPFVQRGDSIYVVVEGPTWDEAQANAQKLGGNLVTINDSEENQFVLNFLNSHPKKSLSVSGAWIGLNDRQSEGVFEWVSGEISGYSNWSGGEPNGIGDSDLCHMYYDGTWNDHFDDQSIVIGLAEIKISEAPAPEMIFVQGGTLPVGSELAGQQVGDFEIGKYEVTWDEWQEVRDWAVANGYTDLANVGAGSGEDHPVRNVSWYDVVKWCNAKSEMEGLVPVYLIGGNIYKSGQIAPTINSAAKGYRLPLEKEWEWSARGGGYSQGYLYSGSNDLNAVAWHWGNSGGAAVPLFESNGTWPVGQKAPNEIGIYDMSGNIWEWCWDLWGMDQNPHRRGRGGSWFRDAGILTVGGSDITYMRYPDFKQIYVGFRLARNASGAVQPATPAITTLPTASVLIFGQALSNSTLTGGVAGVNGTTVAGSFAFASPSAKPAAGNSTHQVVFTPTDSVNYTTATANVTVTVSKAGAVISTLPSASSITFGQALSSSVLTGGAANVAGSFAFASPSAKPAVGNSTQGVVFTPSDSGNYTTATTSVIVTVLDPAADEDGDGLNNSEEFTAGTNPFVGDSDGDGFTDGEETDAGSNPLLADSKPDWADSDGDGVTDYREIADGTNPSDAQSCQQLSKGLKLFYPFEGNTMDESGFRNDGVFVGSNLTASRQGLENTALRTTHLTGLRSLNNVGISGNIDFSVSFWMKPEAEPVWPRGFVMGWGAGGSGTLSHFYYRPYSSNTTLNVDENYVGAEVLGNPRNLAGYWSQITYTYHSSNRSFSFYLNGILQTDNYISYNMHLHNLVDGVLLIAGNNEPDQYGGRAMAGALDNVRIYNRALPDEEVRQLFITDAADQIPPVVSLQGSNPMFIYKGANFTDPGANVTDNVDFPQTIFGNGTVNTSALGNYTLTYTASDFSGNAATPVERIVQVVLDPEGDDDGDGLKNSLETNTGEFVSGNNTGTNPLLADTNDDGFSDGEAVNWGLNPLTDYSAVIGLVKHLSTNDPGRFDLYTTGAIMDMNLGNLVIHKSGNQVMLNLQIQSTPDLGVQPFTNHGSPMQMPVTMPGNKGFLRVRALGAE